MRGFLFSIDKEKISDNRDMILQKAAKDEICVQKGNIKENGNKNDVLY